ncbi:unnamed protein product [Urochloa decumbens]|uniref:CASP-like protein n=1 Tax=Urochloa decumbens TaxID=240449 RepID=A0ABC8ZZI3_9POAL
MAHKVPSSSPFWRPAGTVGCLCLRTLQLVLAVATLAVMASSTGELSFHLRYLAPVALWQCAWSLPLGLLDAQALIASRGWQYQHARTILLTIGDGVTTLVVFTVASGSLGTASAASAFQHAEWPHGAPFKTLVALGFASSAALFTSAFLNYASVVCHYRLPPA